MFRETTEEIESHAVFWNFSVATMDPEKKESINVNPNKKFICWAGLLMLKRGPKFYKQQDPRGHLLVGASHEVSTPGRNWETSWLPAPYALSTQGLRSALSNQNCTIWGVYLHKMGLIDNLGGDFCYKSWLLLCLRGT